MVHKTKSHPTHHLFSVARQLSPLRFYIIQWNLSIVGTFGTLLAVLYTDVSLIQR